jgi:predicted esterase
MFKKSSVIFSLLLSSSLSLFASNISNDDCDSKGDNFIFAGGECIEYRKFNGDTEDKLNIIVHGTWKEGTNTLGRYAPFAENVSMQTDITTVAVALPGYSGSSTNRFPALSHEGANNLSANKDYINFLGDLIEAFKDKYEAQTVTYVGHSAGCSMGATLTGIKPDLINNILCAGGNYDVHKKNDEKGLISIIDVLDNVSKETKFVLVYGTKDDISKPEVTIDFYNLAKEKGFDVKLVEAKDAPHLDLDMTDASVDALINVLEEE